MAEPSKITSISWAAYLGGENTFRITRYDSDVLHTIKYGTTRFLEDAVTICELSSSENISFTLPVSLASANKNGKSVLVIFEICCYLDGKEFHKANISNNFLIPEEVKPTCSVDITDANGLLAKYGAYVQNKSKLRIVTTPTLAYESPIADYKITVDGMSYNLADVVTSEIKSAGDIRIGAVVTDARGRSGSDSASVLAIAYMPPAVVSFTSERVNADGSDNEQGDHIKVTFSASVTPLNNKNSAVYKLEYKKSADSFYTEISASDLDGNYATSDISHIFAADTGSSYDVRLTITDDFHTTVYNNKAQSGFATFHVPASGNGFSFGKVSEIEGLFDVAFRSRFLGGFMQPKLDTGADFDDVTMPNTYACADAATAGYLNCPFESGEFVLEVKETAGIGLIQKAIACDDEAYTAFIRCRVNKTWGIWKSIGESTNRLPSEYKEIPYLESSGTQYIDTGFIPNQNSRIVCDVQITDTATRHLFGARASSSEGAFFVPCLSATTIRADYGSQKNTHTVRSVLDRMTIDLDKTSCTIGGTSTAFTTETFSANASIALFASNTNGTIVVDTYKAKMRLFYCKIYDNGTLVRDYIPCKRNVDGKLGLFDLQNGVFYTNNGTGEFYTEIDIMLPPKDTLENMSWADIQIVCKAGKASEYWSIGDTKMVELEGKIYPVAIIGFYHDTPVDVLSYGRPKAGATFQFLTLLDTSYALNTSGTNVGWSESVFRTRYVPVFMSDACIDQDVAAVIVPVTKLTANGNDTTTITTTDDTLFLLSESEVFGAASTYRTGEGSQYSYYAAGNTKAKRKLDGNSYKWGLRSVRSGFEGTQIVVSESGTIEVITKTTAIGTALAFCV